jgi:hypothetical protein
MAETERAPRSGKIVRALLVAATLGVGVGLAAIPVGNWADQRDDLDDARVRRTELEAEIAEIEADIEGIVGEEGIETASRCYGFFVEVGEELYSIAGVEGCVTNPTP